MVIEAYSGFTKKPNSTKQPSGSGTQLNVKLKENTSVIHPVFYVHAYSFSHNYIKWGSRYYYIDDIVSISNGMAEYICSVDVLATFKADIGNSSQYIARAAGASNENIIDVKYPTLANPTAVEQFLSNIGSAMKLTSSNKGAYILGTISGDSSSGVTYNLMGSVEFKQFLTFMFNGGYLSATDISNDLQKELVNPFQYIASCMWFPFLRDSQHWGDTVKFGFWDSQIGCTVIDEDDRIYSVMDPLNLQHHPQSASRGKYLNNSPYTRRSIEVFGFGSIPIDPSYFVDSDNCSVMVKVDKFTGVGELTVESAGATVLRTSAQVGVPIKISQVTQSVLAPAIAAVGAIGAVAAGNYAGAAAGVGNAITSAMPQVQTTGSSGSKIDFIREPRITSQFYSLSDEDLAQIGRPLCSVRTINTLSGYIQCDNADLDTAASPSEKADIVSNMNGGFYYE